VYILEEARSEIWSISASATFPAVRTLVGALRNPAYIDQFSVDAAGRIFISEATTSSVILLDTLDPNNQPGSPWEILGASSSTPAAQLQLPVATPGFIQIAPVNMSLQMTPLQLLVIGSTSSPTASFFLSNEVVYTDQLTYRSLNLADNIPEVIATDEYGLNMLFGTSVAYAADGLVLFLNGGSGQIRDRYRGIATANFNSPTSFPSSVDKRASNGQYLVADGAVLWTVTGISLGTNPTVNFTSHSLSFSGTTYASMTSAVYDQNQVNIVYFTDMITNTVARYNVQTGVVTPLVSTSSVSCPGSLAIHGNDLYITDIGNGRILHVSTGSNAISTPTVVHSGLNMGQFVDCTSGFIQNGYPAIAIDSTGNNLVFSSDSDYAMYLLN